MVVILVIVKVLCFVVIVLDIDSIKEGQKIDLSPCTRYTWKFTTGKTSYTVTERNDKWSCSCGGFKKKGSCKHIDEIQDSLI